MSESVKMPALGESVTEGTVSRWLKNVGDSVTVDEPLLEVSTDKVDSEVPSPVSGVIAQILVPEDETVEVGTVLCIISEEAEVVSSTVETPPTIEDELPPSVDTFSTQTVETVTNMDTVVNSFDENITPPVPIIPTPVSVSDVYSDNSDSTFTPPPVAIATPVEEKSVVEENPVGKENNVAENTVTSTFTGSNSNESKSSISSEVNSLTYVTPIVRKLAKDNDIDLATIKGTGIGGRIRRQDVQDAITAKLEAEKLRSQSTSGVLTTSVEDQNLRGQTVKMSRLRQVISRRMIESVQVSAQLTSVVEVDCSKIWAVRDKHKADFYNSEGVKLTFLPFFVKIASQVLRNHPKLNASIVGDEVKYHDYEHVGIAVDTPRGLLVPVIRDVNNLSTTGVAKSIADLAARARSNSLNPDELSGSTFTVTNTGTGGSIIDTPIINQPEVAILAVGKITRRPVVVSDEFGNETIGIRPMVYLCLSYDHRLIDGADAGRYLSEVKSIIESGDFSL